MSRALADPLYERLLRAYPPDQAYAPADWADAPMPAPMRHFLQHRLRHQQRQEAQRIRRAHSAWVRYEHPAVQQAQQAYLDAIEGHLCIPADEWEPILQQAARHVTAYLVRPVPVLLAFFFGDSDGTCPVKRAQWRVQYFDTYGYLREAVDAFIRKQGAERIAREPLKRFLYRVDASMTRDYDADQWLRLLAPLFSMARVATDRAELPLPVLRTFFEQKSATACAEKVRAYANQHNAQRLSARHMRDLLTDATAPPEPSASAPPPASALDDLATLDDVPEAAPEMPPEAPSPDAPASNASASAASVPQSSPVQPNLDAPSDSAPATPSSEAKSPTTASSLHSEPTAPTDEQADEEPSPPEPEPAAADRPPPDWATPDRPAADAASSADAERVSGPDGAASSPERPASSWPPPEYEKNWPGLRDDTADASTDEAAERHASDAKAERGSDAASASTDASSPEVPSPDARSSSSSSNPFAASSSSEDASERDDGPRAAAQAEGASTSAAGEPSPEAASGNGPDASPHDASAHDAGLNNATATEAGEGEAGEGGADDESTPLWKRFHRSSDRSQTEAPPDSTSRSSSSDESSADENTPLWARFRAKSDTPSDAASSSGSASQNASTRASAPQNASEASERGERASAAAGGALAALERDVLGAANPKGRNEYVRHLFDDSIADYRSVLEMLQGADTWTEASRIIAREVFRAHHVNIYSDAAVRFTNTVEAQFHE